MSNLLKSIAIATLALIQICCGGTSAETAPKADLGLSSQQASFSQFTNTVSATGVIKPKTGAEVKVGSRLSGLVEKLFVDIGDRVEAGDVLAELDDSELQTQVALYLAKIEEIAADIVYSEQQLSMARANTYSTENELHRLQRDIAVNTARLKQSRANLQLTQTRQSYSQVTAPMAGIIASVSTQQGETIAASFATPTFLTIVDLSRLEIRAYVDESDIGQIAIGQTIRFSVDTFSDVEFSGSVSAIYPKAEIISNVVNYIVIIEFEQQATFPLRPEMTAHVAIEVDQSDKVVMVPRSALLNSDGRYFLLIESDSGWQQRPIKIGTFTTSEVEIINGLTPGEVFLIDSNQFNGG